MSASKLAATVRYPGIAEYNEAVQNASTAFGDPELASGRLATSKLGLPIVLGGGFALTYTVTSKAHKYAVRCFHRYVPDLESRYARISQAIGKIAGPHFVGFEYQRDGVKVKSGRYPVVKMAWAEGLTFGSYVEDNHEDPAAMRALAQKFRELARFLASRGLAHGDLEGSNLVVRNGALTLIDYDGMFVPGMRAGDGNELGHAHFQHPGRETRHFGPRIDDFSFLLIDIALAAIAADKTLYEQFSNGDNLLFQKPDLVNPASSAVFQALRRITVLKAKVDDFAAICRRPIEQVPSLADFLARHETAKSALAASSPALSAPAGRSTVNSPSPPANHHARAATPLSAPVRPQPVLRPGHVAAKPAPVGPASVNQAKPAAVSNLDYLRSQLAARQPGHSGPGPASAGVPAPGSAPGSGPISSPAAPRKRSPKFVTLIYCVEAALGIALLVGILGYQL